MPHWFVFRRSNRGRSVRLGVSQTGKPTYVFYPGDELRLADAASAKAFQRMCEAADLPREGDLTDEYSIVKVDQ